MTIDQELQALDARVRHGLPLVLKGSNPAHSAQQELSRIASEMLRGQMPRNLRGKYSLADKYADKPTFANRPYRTSVMYSSGRAGRRAVPPT